MAHKVAPCGSCSTQNRPMSGISSGGRRSFPPRASIWRAAAGVCPPSCSGLTGDSRAERSGIDEASRRIGGGRCAPGARRPQGCVPVPVVDGSELIADSAEGRFRRDRTGAGDRSIMTEKFPKRSGSGCPIEGCSRGT